VASMRVSDDNQDNGNDLVGAEDDVSTGEDDNTDDESSTGILFDGESLDMRSLGSMFDNDLHGLST
jgi:hypothetical protein